MLPTTLAVSLPEMPFLGDHAIAGKAIVPAVEILNLLLRQLDRQGVHVGKPLVMRDVVFPRFLPADDVSRCTFEIALAAVTGGVRASFASRIALPNGMQRKRVHAEATFGGEAPFALPPPEEQPSFEVSADRLYRELVRFGPRFRNLQGLVRFTRSGAWGTVASPVPPHPEPSAAGCPYLLDSAMHLACVWGQRYAGIVAYPTGFAGRTIVAPIECGRRASVAVPRSVDRHRLLFDLWLLDEDHRVCDAITGLTMAPLAAGEPPPSWIVETDA